MLKCFYSRNAGKHCVTVCGDEVATTNITTPFSYNGATVYVTFLYAENRVVGLSVVAPSVELLPGVVDVAERRLVAVEGNTAEICSVMRRFVGT